MDITSKEIIKKLVKMDGIPNEIICLSCLATQPAYKIIANDDACVICDNPIDPCNLSDVEV